MDDLNGLDWSVSSNAKTNTSKPPQASGNYYPTLRPTPPPQLSGHTTPLSNQASGVSTSKPAAFAPSKSSNLDSFSNLVSFGSSNQTTLTLQQQQEKLQAEKRKKEEETRRQYDAQFGGSQIWDSLGNSGQGWNATTTTSSRSSTPAVTPLPAGFARASSPLASNGGATNDGDEDLFAAFNADTKVDNSSFYPPGSSSGNSTPGIATNNAPDLSQPQAWEQPAASLGGAAFNNDDDPFGLGQMRSQSSAPIPIVSLADSDDFLGDLAKPVEEVRRQRSPASVVVSEPPQEPESDDPWDKAVAELTGMGFSAEQSRRALTESGSGLDIQAAVGWILNDAHWQAKQKQQGRDTSRHNGSSNGGRREVSQEGARKENSSPAWAREDGRDRSQPRRGDSRSPNGETDLSKTAAAVGNNLFKTANSLWKTSQKKVQKAVAEFQQESDPSQPKWMREAAEQEAAERNAAVEGRGRRPQAAVPDVTDEALMLESGSRGPPKKAKAPESRLSPSSSTRQQPTPSSRPPPERHAATPRWQQSAPIDHRSRISKQAVEEQSVQAYISPARRKKATPQPSQPSPEPEPDLLLSSAISSQSKPTPSRPRPQATSASSKPSTPIPIRPKAPPRNIPPLSPAALAKANGHRQTGTDQFKRGDYAAAHQSYSAALLSIPSSHPIAIVLLCNRALTSLKTGIPKSAVSDADSSLDLIGISRGEGETINLGNEQKDMREVWGKALMRKAEALEQMEKWLEAGEVWKQCVENGVGAATAVQGRSRCEKALAPKPARTVTPKPKPKPKAKSALQDLNGGADSAAVERLRKANLDAEKADDEKFALVDKVDEKIGQWRDGKRDNLRALIGSLDSVMWEGSAWKKVGMHELVQNNKVKIHYMKAIGKCHPDKLPQGASTEIRMIAGLVFATLNESWDKFKQQNGM